MFTIYGDEIFQHVHLMVGNRMDAEDLVQEIFLQVLRSWDKFGHRSGERTWLWAITRNCIKQFFRTKHRRLRQIESARDNLEDKFKSDPVSQLILEEGLQRLEPPLREIFILRILQDKSSAEAAELLGWSEAKVRVNLHSAMKRLREFFGAQAEGGEHHGFTGF